MEKAKIQIKETAKGHDVILFLENGKQIKAPNFNISKKEDGKECLIERNKGQLIRIVIGDRTFTKNAAQSEKKYSSDNKSFKYSKQKRKASASKPSSTKNSAHAPYNFVPLNSCIVVSDAPPYFDRYHKDRYSGYIELDIVIKTPLYIRGTSDDKSDFFSPGGITKIPGSSLRGMVRTLVEITSWGKFENFEKDKRLFYRAVGDSSRIGKNYREIMVDENDNFYPKIKVGILKFEQNRFRLYPSKTDGEIKVCFYRINGNFNNQNQFVIDKTDIKVKEFDFKKIYFKPVLPDLHTHYRTIKTTGEKVPFQLKYALVEKISQNPKDDYIEGYLLASGKLGNKKHLQWIIMKEHEKEPLEVPEDLIKIYNDDQNRHEKANLLNLLNKNPDGVPCCYITDQNNKIKACGHTGNFRLPYELTIGDHVPDNIKQNDITDIPEAIFGKEGKWASRVFFEDAEVCEGQSDIFLSETSPKILASPKPTTFQHYLEQPEDVTKDTLKHWNDKNAFLRGHKLYWHRDTNNSEEYSWIAEKIEINKADFDKFLKFKNINTTEDLINSFDKVKQEGAKLIINCKFSEIPDSDFKNILKDYLLVSEETKTNAKIKGGQYTVIEAVKPQVYFEGKIRFENLSKIELGALLFALDLPENCCHKLGMGKPLGLGSIKITPKLFVINRGNRYASLFDKGDWHLAIEEKNSNDFISEFEKYIFSHISEVDKKGADKLWDTPRMKALNIMLDWKKTEQSDWLKATRYMDMELKEFKDRPILRGPKTVEL